MNNNLYILPILIFMKKFLLKTILFIAVFLVLDNTTGYLLSLNRPSDYKQFLNSKIKFFDSVNTVDMLVIGSSCIADALDPRSIERNIKLKTYNLGIYHSSPFQNYYVTKVARKAPIYCYYYCVGGKSFYV